jgi:long-chain acyl-CoA synthetase
MVPARLPLDSKAMEKLWFKHYPNGVSHEIDPHLYSSLAEIIEEACKGYSDKVAFSNMGAELTFGEVLKRSHDFASYLQNELGLKKGDRIAIQSPNLLQYPIVLFGALMSGVVVVNTNPLYSDRDPGKLRVQTGRDYFSNFD